MSSEPESCEESEVTVEGQGVECEVVCETETYVVGSDDEEQDEDDTQSETLSVDILEGQRPVRPVERQKMRPWLIDLLDKNILPGLSWQNKKENIFRISWKHAAHNCFNRNRDSDLFERWAFHTGRHHEGNHKRWKANFRCALNSLPDVMELKELGVRKGDNAFKVYKFLDSADPTDKEKMEIKLKYGLLAGIKLEESQSGSSTPTVSTAPSSPDPESVLSVDGGIQALLKAIELKTQQQKEPSRTPRKRAATGSSSQGKSKWSKKSNKDGDSQPSEGETTIVISTGRPSPASTPGSDKDSGQQRPSYISAVDPKTGTITLVELRKSDSQSSPSTPTGSSPAGGNTLKQDAAVPISKMLINLPVQGQTVATGMTQTLSPSIVKQEFSVPVSKMLINFPGQGQTIATGMTPSLRPGEHFVTVPYSIAERLHKETTMEQRVTIPFQVLQQELLQKQPQNIPGLVHLGALLAGNTTTSLQIAKQLESAIPTIPLTVLEQINQAKLKEKQKLPAGDDRLKSDTQQAKMAATQQAKMAATTADNTSMPVPQLNRNITSIAAALRMSTPSSQPTSTVVVTPSVPVSQPITTTFTASLPQDPQGIRSKLVSRLMVSGSSASPGVRSPGQVQMAAPTAIPRPRLDHLLVKPNPNLALPRTQLQPVKPTETVVMATATSSNIDVLTKSGPPKLIPVSDLNSIRTVATTTLTTEQKSKEPEVTSASVSGVPSPARTPELRPDILDRQLTIELSKMEKEGHTTKPSEDTQHYLCLWCQIDFEKKSDLLHHFLQLHQDMLVVPDEGEGQESRNQATQVSSTSQEMVADVSSTTPITVGDVSSTSSDLVPAPYNSQEDDDDEEPVIIDVMINTSQSQQNVSSQAQAFIPQRSNQEQGNRPRPISNLPTDDLSNASTISASESLDSVSSKPKYSLNDLINALSQSLAQDQASAPPLSVMLSPALQQFNLAQATALKADPGLSGIPSTVMGATARGRGRGRGRGSSSGRGRGRKKKNADVSPEMPELVPEVKKTDICYDNLPESSESTDDEGPPKIPKIVSRRMPKSRTPSAKTSPEKISTVTPKEANEEPFIPGTLQPSTSRISDSVERDDDDDDDASDQAIHVTVKMYEVNGKTMYRCTECGKDFSKTCTFARHAMLHSKMYPYQCGICDMKCGDMRILLRHLDQHAEDADCPCQKCDRMNKEFSEETQRKVGAAFHFKCNICGKKFFSDYACKLHVNAHKRKMTLTCEHCKLEFRCNRILSRHRKAVHDTQFCPVCLETCSNLMHHMRSHEGFTLFRCGLCGDGFNSRPLLHDHLKIHTQLGAKKPASVNASSKHSGSKSQDTMLKHEQTLKDEREAQIATETLIALGTGQNVATIPVVKSQEHQQGPSGIQKTEQASSGQQSPTDFIVRTGEYEDERGEIDVHVIPKTRSERFKSKTSDFGEDKDISIEPATSQSQRDRVTRRCRWHGNDSLCERCDDSLAQKMTSNKKRRGSSRGRRGSKSPRSDYSDSLRLNSDSLDSLKNIEFSLPLANYILRGDDSKQELPGEPPVIELSD